MRKNHKLLKLLPFAFAVGACCGAQPEEIRGSSGEIRGASGSDAQCPKSGCCIVGLAESAVRCGCEPLAQALEARSAIVGLKPLARAEISRCVNGNLSTKIYDVNLVSAKADACVREEVKLDPEVRSTLLKVVEDYKSSAENMTATWKGCYERALSADD